METHVMRDVAIVGSAVMPNAIYAQPDDDLLMRCVVNAARDAGVKKEEIRALISMTPRSHTTQQYQTQHVSSRLGLKVDMLCEFELSALGMCNALAHAANLIRTRDIPAVAIMGCSRESTVPTSEFFGSRTSRTSDASFIGPFGMTPMSWNALGAREMMADGEATEENFADVSVRLRRQAIDNPYAYFRKAVTREEVLASRMVSSPTRLLMVCPRTDGAGCVIVAREDIAKRAPDKAIVHVAQGMAHDGDNIIPERAGRSMWHIPAAGRAVVDAFERSGLEHGDIDVVEPWIPFAPLEVMVMRSMGFPGDYGTSMCVSPSGGPIARGYPLLATGFYNWHELVQQLRGTAGRRQKPDARFGMAVSETGNYNECVVDIFARFDGSTA
ncbi:thiolase family protein [Pigmentiphaga sp. H8]|uniref:thiolase family protein n=1 Tax=Pigmentiphaga sp. H8 TaxID=2488560 RepID=UPI0013763246|nr:thiolase family protein [Pigmentiphaga sp. H8]